MRIALRPALLIAAAAVLIGGCAGAEPTGGGSPTPGALKVNLTSPNPTDAGIFVRLVGNEISNVTVSGSGRTMYVRNVSPTVVVVVILGPVSAGELLRFDVPDTRQRASYVANVLEVVDPTDALREPPSGYALQILR